MDIKELIRHRIFENSFGIYDSEGNITNVEKFRDEYKALRNYLSTHHRSSAPIGIKLPKNPYYLMTILACMESGVAYVPIRENYPQNRIDQIKDESGFEQLITMDFLSHIIEQNTPAACELKSNAQDTLYTICTSGSTGKPKAVVVPRGAITDFWKWCDNYFKDIDQSDRVLQVADFTFDISLIDVGLFLTKGASLYFSKFAGNIFILALEIEKNKITFLNTVVNNFNMLLEDSVYSRADLTSLKYVVMGGARFTTGLYNKCVEHFSTVEVNNLYGVTEVPVYSHAKKMSFDNTDLDEINVSIGTPLGTTTAIIIKDGSEVKQGERGELLLGGGQLMKGYANNPEKTKEVLINLNGNTYYKTGDISYQSQNGEFYIVGRMDDTIKYRGYRIDLLDIDSYIQKLPYIKHAVTFAVPDELTQNKTICYIQLSEEQNLKQIKKDLAKDLLDYQIPEKVLLVDSFPINENGKVCKKTLKSYHLEVK